MRLKIYVEGTVKRTTYFMSLFFEVINIFLEDQALRNSITLLSFFNKDRHLMMGTNSKKNHNYSNLTYLALYYLRRN